MPWYGNEANCLCFFSFQTLTCSISRILERSLADLLGESMYYCLTYLISFIILAQSILINVTSLSLVPNFCSFSENRLFLDSNSSCIETVGS